MSTVDKNGIPRLPPSQDPERIEVLLIDSFDLTHGENALVIFAMNRDGEGSLLALTPLEIEKLGRPGVVDSPLLDAFIQGFSMGGHWTPN